MQHKFIVSGLILSLLSFGGLAYAKLENGMEADMVLGQPDFTRTTSNTGGRSAKNLDFPSTIHSDGKRLYVADYSNNRVLIWSTIPKVNFTPADIVLGQPDFTTAVSNNGGASNRSLSLPAGVFFDGKKFFVSDSGNHRVLVWNSLPQSNFQPADIVVGQPDFATVSAGTSALKMNSPVGICVANGQLLISDVGNNRVLIFNTTPSQSGARADAVLGQPNFVTGTSGITASKMNAPYSLSYDGKRLFVSDLFNQRVLIWEKLPQSANDLPTLVLGQTDFTTNSSGTAADKFDYPVQVFSDGMKVFVADQTNRRVLVWTSIPTTNGAAADVVLGQNNFTTASTAVSQSIMARTYGVSFDGKRVVVSQSYGNRIFIYNIASKSKIKLGPQFEQGKAVLGKVFNDVNGNGVQDRPQTIDNRPQKRKNLSTLDHGPWTESGISGVKVVSDTGIYAITDEDGKYHFPFMETGQRVLKIDTDTLPEGAVVTTDNPYKVVVTKGVLTKVSFGVKLADSRPQTTDPREEEAKASNILLKASVTQESSQLKPRLSVSAVMLYPKDKEYQKLSADPQSNEPKIFFTIDCNYFLFIKRAELKIYDENQKLAKTLVLPRPLPLYYEIPLSEFPGSSPNALVGDPGSLDSRLRGNDKEIFYYQLSVYDAQNHEDRTSVGAFQV